MKTGYVLYFIQPGMNSCQYCTLLSNIIMYFLNQGAAKHIKIHEDSNGGIYTVGVTMKQVTSAKEVITRIL